MNTRRIPGAYGGTLRVAVVTESFLPSVNGVARCVGRAVDHLLDNGHVVLIVCPGPGPDRYRSADVVRLRSVPLPWCPDFPVGLPTRRLRTALAGFEPDVVHLASPIVVGWRGAAIAEDLGVPSVAVYQTDVAGFASQYGWGLAEGMIWRWLRRLHGRADLTLAPSRQTVAVLRRHDVPEVHRWARGVDHDAFSPHHRTRPPTVRVRTVRVGYVGRLATEKRVDRLAVVADLRRVSLTVVGDGPVRADLERALPTASFTGMLGGTDLSRAFADLDVFVHTGTHETFCQAAQEALASGVAVVAPAAGGLLDLVDHGRNGFLWRPDRPEDISDLVRELVSDPGRRAEMGRAARQSVEGRTWHALGDQLLGHYGTVLHSRTARIDRVA